MINAVSLWNSLKHHEIHVNEIKYDQLVNEKILEQIMSFKFNKYITKDINDETIKKYNDEINKILKENIIKEVISESIDISQFMFRDLYIGLYELYKDLKILDNINDGYIFFDESKFNEKYIYYGIIVIVASVFSLNLMEDKTDFSFYDIYKNNPLILFFLCCYVFFDNLLDSPDVDKQTKKLVVIYIDQLFKTGKRMDEFNGLEKKYVSTINNIFSILLNYELKKYSHLYESMYKIFMTEVKTNKYQTFENKDDKKDIDIILNMSMDKGRETLIASWQIFYINLNFRACDELMILADHMGFLFQLLDDLDDIDIDIKENNVTLFSYPYLYGYEDTEIKHYMEKNVGKLITYTLNFKNELNKIKCGYVSDNKKKQYAYAFLIYLNYCIAKNSLLKDMFMDHEHIFPMKYDDIMEFYNKRF